MSKIIDATLRFVDKFTSPMGKAISAMEKSQKQAKRLGSSIEKTGKKIEKTGKSLTTKVTAPIVALGATAIKTAADFEASMSKVQAISGVSGEDLQRLSEKAQEMGAKTKYSAKESADAMSYMALAGWKTDDMINGIAGVMNLAAASGEDLASVSDIVTDALTAFGLTAKDSGHFADVLAAASSNSNTTVAAMGETFKYCASIAGAMGYSVEDTSVAIGLMANSGIKASNAGTAMRKMMTQLQGVVEVQGEGIGKVAIACSNADGSMRDLNDILIDCRTAFKGMSEEEKAANAEALVGKTAMAGFLAVMNASEQDINKLSGAINNCDGVSQSMADTMNNNLTGQLTLLKSQLEGVAIMFGNKLTPYVKKATGFVSSLATKFSNLNDDQQNTVIKVGLVLASIGPLHIVVGKVTKGVGSLIKNTRTIVKVMKLLNVQNVKTAALWVKTKAAMLATKAGMIATKAQIIALKTAQVASTVVTKAATIAQAALNATFLGCPIVWIIGAIAALIAVGVLLYKNWDTVKEKAGQCWAGIKKAFGGIGEWFSGIWDGVKTGFKTFVNFILKGINKIPEGLNKISLDVPEWVPGIGGKTLGFNLPTIPYLYKGTDNWKGGLAITQDRGGEIMDLPKGTRVYPHDESVKQAYKDGKRNGNNGLSINVTKLADKIEVRQDSDIDKIVDKMAQKLLTILENGGAIA